VIWFFLSKQNKDVLEQTQSKACMSLYVGDTESKNESLFWQNIKKGFYTRRQELFNLIEAKLQKLIGIGIQEDVIVLFEVQFYW